MATSYNDGVAVGRVGSPTVPLGVSNIPASSQQGVTLSAIPVYNIVPLALLANNFRTAAAIAGAGAVALTAGTSLTSTTINNAGVSTPVIAMDVPRNIRITSAGNDTGITFTVTGFDVYGQPMSETITGANAGVASGAKAFAFVVPSMTASGAAAGNVSVGTGDVFGLPFFVGSLNYVIAKWAGTLAVDTGTLVAGVTTAATATTGDVRGTYAPSSASNGTRRLTVFQFVADVDTTANVYGVTQA